MISRMTFKFPSPSESFSSTFRTLWKKLGPLPGGKLIFSRLIGRWVPYTGSISATIDSLEVGRAEILMKDRPQLRNHLHSVHAIALANLAELAGNAAVLYSMPDDARFIVAGIQVSYLKKARGTLRAISKCPPIESSERKEYTVSVDILDEGGELVSQASLQTLVGPSKKSKKST